MQVNNKERRYFALSTAKRAIVGDNTVYGQMFHELCAANARESICVQVEVRMENRFAPVPTSNSRRSSRKCHDTTFERMCQVPDSVWSDMNSTHLKPGMVRGEC